MHKTIEIIVSPKGETRLETKGFTGQACKAASKFVEDALGERSHEELTLAFYSQQSSSHVNAGNGD